MCMNFRWINFLLVALFMGQCQHRDFGARYYTEQNSIEFLSHIESLTGHSIFADTSHSNVVFLLVQETSCSSCLSEVRWWEENQQNFEDTKIYILVTSKYESVGKSFIERQGITIYPIFDTTNDLRAKDLVPILPTKLLMTRDGKIQKIHPIDSGKKLDIFIEALTK